MKASTINKLLFLSQSSSKSILLVISYDQKKFQNLSNYNKNMQLAETTHYGLSHPSIEKTYISQVVNDALSFTNLIVGEQIAQKNVPIFQNQYIHQIKTLGNPQLPHIVLIHGFGGSSLHYIRIFQALFMHYQVHALDLYGFGLSSLGEYKTDFTHTQAIDYFIDAIQQWRKVSKIKKFQIVGHSFGGYIITCYAKKYRERVQRIILLSPLGYGRVDYENLSIFRKIFLYLGSKIFGTQPEPSKIMNKAIIGPLFRHRIVRGRLRIQTDRQRETWLKYLEIYSLRQNSSQVSLYQMFEWPLDPVGQSIDQIIIEEKFQVPIEVYFGDIDWMQKRTKSQQRSENLPVHFQIVRSAGHQLIFDNPEQIAKLIIRNKNLDSIISPFLSKK